MDEFSIPKDPRIGKYYITNSGPLDYGNPDIKAKIELLKVINIYWDYNWACNVMEFITTKEPKRIFIDKAVMLRYLKEATSEVILLYWSDDYE